MCTKGWIMASASAAAGAIRLLDLAPKHSKTHGQCGPLARLVVGNIMDFFVERTSKKFIVPGCFSRKNRLLCAVREHQRLLTTANNNSEPIFFPFAATDHQRFSRVNKNHHH